MSSKLRLRVIFRPLIKGLAKIFSKMGITPNIATCIMLALAILSFFILVFMTNLLFFGIFVFLTGIFDGIDGAIARLLDKSTKFGGFFDSIMDRISEFFIFLSLLIFNWNFQLWGILDLKLVIFISYMASFMISYLRSKASVLSSGDFDIGLMARSERLFYIFISSLIAHFIGFFSELLFIFMWLLIFTVVVRYLKSKRIINKSEDENKLFQNKSE